MKEIDLNLSRIGDGAIQEKFDFEMEQVMRNIMDLNTDPEKKRQIILTIDVESDKEGEMMILSVTSKSKLVARDSTGIKVLYGRNDSGYLEAAELKSGVRGQTYIDPEDGLLKTDTGQPVDELERNENGVISFKKKG